MARRVKIDFFTVDETNQEFVLYLVEEGPWRDIDARLSALQARMYDAIDVAVDGHLGRLHPESLGRNIRVQIDLHGDPPSEVDDLVLSLAAYIEEDDEYQHAIQRSPHIDRLRVFLNHAGAAAPKTQM